MADYYYYTAHSTTGQPASVIRGQAAATTAAATTATVTSAADSKNFEIEKCFYDYSYHCRCKKCGYTVKIDYNYIRSLMDNRSPYYSEQYHFNEYHLISRILEEEHQCNRFPLDSDGYYKVIEDPDGYTPYGYKSHGYIPLEPQSKFTKEIEKILDI